MAKQLTPIQHHWLKHIKASQQMGTSMKAYADQQNLKAGVLYTWKNKLIKLGALTLTAPQAATFQKVQVTSAAKHPSSPCRIHLHNGITIEWPIDGDPIMLGTLLEQIKKLT